MTELTNAELDAAVAGFMWTELMRKRDDLLYKRVVSAYSHTDVTPNRLAQVFDISQQRAYASLDRLRDQGIAYTNSKYDRDSGHNINIWKINEGALVRHLLHEVSRWQNREKEGVV